MVLLVFQHTFLPSSMWRQVSVLGSAASRVAPSPSGGSGSFSPFGPSRGGPPGIFLFFSMPALFHFGNSPASGGFGVEYLQPSLEFSGKLSVPPLALVPLVLHSPLHCANKGFLPPSVGQWGGQLKHLYQGSTSNAGRSGLVDVLDRVYHTMPSLHLN